MEQKYLILCCLIAFVVFLYSLEIHKFSVNNLIFLLILGIILFFGSRYIIYLLSKGTSMIIIIGLIIFASFVYYFGKGIYFILEHKAEINKHWPEYKCRPNIMPFAGWLIGPENISGTDNFKNCLWSIHKSFFDILMSPFVDIIKLITDILSNIVNDIQNIRQMVSYMRDSIQSMAQTIMDKIWSAYVRIAFLLKTIVKTFAQLGQVFKDIFDVFSYLADTLQSIWNGPIGGVARFFCFDEDTLINDVKIKNIKLDNHIIGILKMDASQVQMYKYKDVIVSGKHMVFENDKWIRVEKSLYSLKLNYEKKYVYSLITTNGEIIINNIRFKDFIELDNMRHKTHIYNYSLRKLENRNKMAEMELVSGFHRNTKIVLKNGTTKNIKEIRIGDETKYGKVLGIVRISPLKYKFDICEWNGIIATENIIVNVNKWIPITLLDSVILDTRNYKKTFYNLITEKQMIECEKNGIRYTFRDFELINTENMCKKIDSIINRKNEKKKI